MFGNFQRVSYFKPSLFFPHKKCEKILQCAFRRATSIAFEMYGNFERSFESHFRFKKPRPESKIVHLHILQCRLCNFQPHFKGIERDICDYFFSESPCLLCMLNPFFLIYVMKPSLHPLAVIST